MTEFNPKQAARIVERLDEIAAVDSQLNGDKLCRRRRLRLCAGPTCGPADQMPPCFYEVAARAVIRAGCGFYSKEVGVLEDGDTVKVLETIPRQFQKNLSVSFVSGIRY